MIEGAVQVEMRRGDARLNGLVLIYTSGLFTFGYDDNNKFIPPQAHQFSAPVRLINAVRAKIKLNGD